MCTDLHYTKRIVLQFIIITAPVIVGLTICTLGAQFIFSDQDSRNLFCLVVGMITGPVWLAWLVSIR